MKIVLSARLLLPGAAMADVLLKTVHSAAEHQCGTQGCVEILYILVQGTIYCSIVYWMCWFQRDAGTHSFLVAHSVMLKLCCVAPAVLHSALQVHVQVCTLVTISLSWFSEEARLQSR